MYDLNDAALAETVVAAVTVPEAPGESVPASYPVAGDTDAVHVVPCRTVKDWSELVEVLVTSASYPVLAAFRFLYFNVMVSLVVALNFSVYVFSVAAVADTVVAAVTVPEEPGLNVPAIHTEDAATTLAVHVVPCRTVKD